MGGVFMCASACIRSLLLCLPWGCINGVAHAAPRFQLFAFLMCLAHTPAQTFFASVWQRRAAVPSTFAHTLLGYIPVGGAVG